MYAFFLLKYSKSYLHTCSLYVYLCHTEVSHPSQSTDALNLRPSRFFYFRKHNFVIIVH